jgi:carboxyl-terminal processing protease
MKLRNIFLVVALIIVGCDKNNPQTAGINYLNEVLDVMEKNSINRNLIDWPSFRAETLDHAKESGSIKDVYPAISFALKGLGDHHSGYTSSEITITAYDKECTAFSYDETPPADIGYLRIGAYSGSTGDVFAADLQNRIRKQDNAGIVGWVVDLRGNTGGNMWPMLAGVGPILGEGIAGYFIDPSGQEETWEYKQGKSMYGTIAINQVSPPYTLINKDAKVAVLIDQLTASSGEAIAISFIGRPNTKLFGTPTCGLSTSNANYTLSDGATLILTVAVMADRNKNKKGDVIAPDVANEIIPKVFPQAIDWIRQ